MEAESKKANERVAQKALAESEKTNKELRNIGKQKTEGDTNVAVASQQSVSSGKTSQEESPDEIESMGIVFMNKTTFGPGL
jgi:hypothetical protein